MNISKEVGFIFLIILTSAISPSNQDVFSQQWPPFLANGYDHDGISRDEMIKTKAEEGYTKLINNGTTSFSSLCQESLDILTSGFESHDEWAKNIFDSWGKPGSRVLEGNTYWLGSYDQCHSYRPPSVNGTNFQVKFCLLSGSINTTVKKNVAAKLGVCFPASCQSNDVPALASILTSKYSHGRFYFTDAKCEEVSQSLDTPAICVIVILCFIGVLIIFGTVYDVIAVQKVTCGKATDDENYVSYQKYDEDIEPPMEIRRDLSQSNAKVFYGTFGTFNGGMDRSEERIPRDIEVAEKETNDPVKRYSNPEELFGKSDDKENILRSLVLSFSLYTNGANLLKVKKGTNEMTCLHGLRFFSMTWVMLWHTIFYWWISFGSLRNTSAMFQYLRKFEFQVAINATLAVDSFFVLSGLLVASSLLRNLKKNKGPKGIFWPKFYFHRFWRLTPPYMLILGLYAAVFKYLGNGPIWPQEGPENWCKTNWWTNLLYVNNLVQPNKMCMGHSWYLSSDMQFYIISPLVIVPFFAHWVAGVAVSGIIILASTCTIAALVIMNNYPSGNVGVFNDLSKQPGWWTDIYVAPWNHIGPYVVGIVVGFILFKTDRIVRMRRPYVVLGWILATICNFLVVYGLYAEAQGERASSAESIMYNSLHRTAWAVGLAWVIVACSTGYGGPINKLLSWSIMVPLSRLTYMAYLVHPMIMQWFYLSRRTPLDWDDGTLVYIHIANIVISYAAAFLLTLTIEIPWSVMERQILKHRKKTK